MNKVEILYKEESFNIVGAAMEVHRIIGCGFTEPIYQEALEEEFKLRGIPYQREKTIYVTYKGKVLSRDFRPDFICYDKIIVELKAVSELTDTHKAQVRNYLTITNYELGILCNFNELYMEPVRVLNSNLHR